MNISNFIFDFIDIHFFYPQISGISEKFKSEC